MKRSPLRKVSPKRAAYRASKAGRDGIAHMMRVKAMPCVACGRAGPSEAHHCRSNGMARDDMKTIPLCIPCHRGPQGYHLDKANWHAKHGPDYGFLPVVNALLDAETEIDF